MCGPRRRRHCGPAEPRTGASTGPDLWGLRIKALSRSSETSHEPPWRAEIVVLAEPFRCMATGQDGYHLGLLLTSIDHSSERPILLDPAAIAGLIESGVDILDAGLQVVMDEEGERW